MNEILKNLLSRRSIRAYSEKQIPKADLETIVEAGKAAASAMNRQPYHITVVQNPAALEKIKAAVPPGPRGGNCIYSAPCFILVSGDSAATAVYDAALVTGNMYLAARSLGIGSCWLYTFGAKADEPEMQALYKELGVPDGYKALVGSCFGYPSSDWPDAPERKTDNVNWVL